MIHTLLRPEGPTDIQIRSARASKGSEPTAHINVNRGTTGWGLGKTLQTERWVIVATDIALRMKNQISNCVRKR